MVLILSEDDIRSIFNVNDAIEVVEESFRTLALGRVVMPLRHVIRIEKHRGVMGVMPAYVSSPEAAGLKIFTIHPENPVKNSLPTTLATTLLINPKNGVLISLMEGTYLTAIRTGAASAVATNLLARVDSKTTGIIGSGVQARTQLTAISKVRSLDLVKVYSPSRGHREAFAYEMSSSLGIKVQAVDEARKAVEGSDIIVTATTSKEPVIDGDWLKAGVHINAIGSHTPDARELDIKTIQKAKIVVDTKEAALKEAGDIIIPLSKGIISESHIHAELGEIIIGRKPGRISPKEVTVFKYQGLAVQDVLVSQRVYESARRHNVGKDVKI